MRTLLVNARSIAIGCCGLLVIACGSGSESPSRAGADLVTPDQAKQAALAYVHAGLSAEIAAEAGSLRRIDDAMAVVNPIPSPAPTLNPKARYDVTVWVAHQSHYPLSFLCLCRTTIPDQNLLPQLFRFSKAEPAAPWIVSYQLQLPLAAVPSLALDGSGYAQLVTPDQFDKFLVSPARLSSEYVAYLKAGDSADSHQFASGDVTSRVIDAMNNEISAHKAAHANMTVSLSPTEDPVDAYRLRDGSALVLLGVSVTAHVVATSAPLKVEKDGKGVAGPAPGAYRDVTTDSLNLVGFSVPPKGSSAKIAGLGVYSGLVRSTATPA
jgi:hypothetical protein